MMAGPNKRTIWARRNRGIFDAYTGCKVEAGKLDRLREVAKRLNVDVSDLLRAMIDALALLPLKPLEIGADWDELQKVKEKKSPTTSDKMCYV